MRGSITFQEVKQFLQLFPAGPTALAIAVNAFLGLRKPECQALLADDYDAANRRIRIHRDTKTGNDVWLPVVEPLATLLADWTGEQIRLIGARYHIRQKIKGTNLQWKGWYGYRRGLSTNLFQLGMRPEEACLILRNSPEVVRKHYIRLQQEGVKQDAMTRFEQAYCAASVQQISQKLQ